MQIERSRTAGASQPSATQRGQESGSGVGAVARADHQRSALRVSTSGFDVPEVAVIRKLLYPFRVSYVGEGEHSDVSICKGNAEKRGDDSRRQILIPAYNPSTSALVEAGGNGVAVLPYDILTTTLERFESVMHPEVSVMYNLSTRLPFDYNVVPSSIRSRVLRTHQQGTDSDLLRHLSVEVSRRKLAEAFAEVGLKLERKQPPSITITHDVDTAKGLERAPSLKKIEDDLGIRSTWFVVSGEYPITQKVAKSLGENSDIGSHDEKHDGRLIGMKKQEDLVSRLRNSREALSLVFERNVTSFRSPLLQFNSRIVSALGKAGYQDDYSLPCWEPVHPSTMGGFGIESASMFEVGGVVEHPLSLFQDHQVLKVLGMSTATAVKFWMNQIGLIRAFDGDIVLLVHPDYSFAQDLESYRRLLELISILRTQDQTDVFRHGLPSSS